MAHSRSMTTTGSVIEITCSCLLQPHVQRASASYCFGEFKKMSNITRASRASYVGNLLRAKAEVSVIAALKVRSAVRDRMPARPVVLDGLIADLKRVELWLNTTLGVSVEEPNNREV